MQLEVRGETTVIDQFMMKRTEEICRGAAAMQGCACEMTVMGMAEGQHSDGQLIERMGRVIRRDLPNLTLSTEQNAKNWGSDDVSVMYEPRAGAWRAGDLYARDDGYGGCAGMTR